MDVVTCKKETCYAMRSYNSLRFLSHLYLLLIYSLGFLEISREMVTGRENLLFEKQSSDGSAGNL